MAVAPLQPSNCGFEVQGGWSEYFRSRFAGQPFKSVAIALASADGQAWRRKGEFVATELGVEGSLNEGLRVEGAVRADSRRLLRSRGPRRDKMFRGVLT